MLFLGEIADSLKRRRWIVGTLRRAAARGVRGRRGAAAVEFALCAIPFLILLLGTFEESFDLFQQEVMDTSLHLAVRDLQTGLAQNLANGNAFISSVVCTKINGLLPCNTTGTPNLFVQVEKISPSATQDYYDYTYGSVPTSGGAFQESSFDSSTFCNAGPAQLILVTAIYIGPTFIGHLLPGAFTVQYNGNTVRATMSAVGAVTEAFTQVKPSAGTKVAAVCS
jgi:hypothetical protein